jgi:hypothetical protein
MSERFYLDEEDDNAYIDMDFATFSVINRVLYETSPCQQENVN